MVKEIDNTIKQYVVFQLEHESYGVDIQSVQGIERIKKVTRVPKAPDCIQGVMNLRGEIIPVMSLRTQFDLPHKEYDDNTRIIIIRIDDSQIGLIVDEVREVLELHTNEIENVQSIQGKINLNYIYGVGKIKSGTMVITLLNLKSLIEETLMQ